VNIFISEHFLVYHLQRKKPHFINYKHCTRPAWQQTEITGRTQNTACLLY